MSLADEELREETADFHTAVPYEINYKTIRQAETPRIPWFMNVYDVYDHFPSFSIISHHFPDSTWPFEGIRHDISHDWGTVSEAKS